MLFSPNEIRGSETAFGGCAYLIVWSHCILITISWNRQHYFYLLLPSPFPYPCFLVSYFKEQNQLPPPNVSLSVVGYFPIVHTWQPFIAIENSGRVIAKYTLRFIYLWFAYALPAEFFLSLSLFWENRKQRTHNIILEVSMQGLTVYKVVSGSLRMGFLFCTAL